MTGAKSFKDYNVCKGEEIDSCNQPIKDQERGGKGFTLLELDQDA
jgi:hypothetical protein